MLLQFKCKKKKVKEKSYYKKKKKEIDQPLHKVWEMPTFQAGYFNPL